MGATVAAAPLPSGTTFSFHLAFYPVMTTVAKRRKGTMIPLSSSRKPYNYFLRFGTRSLLTETVQGQTSFEFPSAESVPRRLILLRHAESSWEHRSLGDHDRPLSKTGQDDAIKVSHKLQQLDWVPQVILCSDALRTRETLKIMQNQVLGFLKAEVLLIPSFYSIAAMDGQTAQHLQKAICRYSRDDILTVMCMGHNRGWEEAASVFSGHAVELKTCNAALLKAVGKSWEEAFSLAGHGGWKLLGIVKPDVEVEV